MIRLNAGNVLLKPSHRRQLMAWLKRSIRLGERLGDFILTLSMERIGHSYQMKAQVHDSAGEFTCRIRKRQWRDALHDIVHLLSTGLRVQNLRRT